MQSASAPPMRELFNDDEHDESELRDYLYDEDIDLDGATGFVEMIGEDAEQHGAQKQACSNVALSSSGTNRPTKRKRGRPRDQDADERAKKRKLASMATAASKKKLPTTEAQKTLRRILNDDLVSIMLKIEFINGRLAPYLQRTQDRRRS